MPDQDAGDADKAEATSITAKAAIQWLRAMRAARFTFELARDPLGSSPAAGAMLTCIVPCFSYYSRVSSILVIPNTLYTNIIGLRIGFEEFTNLYTLSFSGIIIPAEFS